MACIAKRRGRYVIDFYDTKGNRRWKTLPEGTTKKQAREKLREIEDQLLKGIYIPDQKIPTFEDVAKDWLEQKELNVRASTLRMYEGHLKRHFSEINGLRVNRISISTVERFITNKQKQGMNLTTLRKIIVTFNQVINYCVRHRYIDFNPVRDSERPKNRGQVEKSKIRVLNPGEIKALLETEEDQKYRILFKLAIMSGARQGELLGLKWTDIDWFNNQIRIQRTFNEGAWYQPKSKSSTRCIDIGPAMISDLKKWHIACPASKLNLVFPNESGNPINHRNMLQRHFYPALKAAGIGPIRFHDLRHTYASLLIDQGENIKYIQSQLGHANPSITLNVYAHLIKPVNQLAAKQLETTIFGTGSKTVAENKSRTHGKPVSP